MIGQLQFNGEKLLGSKTAFRFNADAKFISGVLLQIPNIDILHDALPDDIHKKSSFLTSLSLNNGTDKVFADVPLIYYTFQSSAERKKRMPLMKMFMICNYNIINNAVHYLVLKPERIFLQFINQNSSIVDVIKSLDVNLYYKY